MMRPGTRAGDFRVDAGKARLTGLLDQVDRDVELRGRAWDRNGHWVLEYRSTNLYVEGMEKLPGWNADKHGTMVVITGHLEWAALPDIEQLILKPYPDLKEQYIVRRSA